MKRIQIAKEVIDVEIDALNQLKNNLDGNFDVCVDKILSSEGRVIISGVGKSGIIGKKVAASLASTGTPSFFLHPTEAFHGDFGMAKREDIFILISNSGETEEVIKMLAPLKSSGNYIISLTGNVTSSLAQMSDCNIDISVPREACKLQLAPTASTTATLVLGDALTIALMEERNFSMENFAKFHPGGSLGRKLLSRVKDEMLDLPRKILDGNDDFSSVVSCISSNRLGFSIVSMEGVPGIITDGDLRRTIEKYGDRVFQIKAKEMATLNPLTIDPQAKTETAFNLMEKEGVNLLLVEEDRVIVGVIKK